MFDVMIAKKFIENVSEYTDYNVNIMDHKGIIIASKDKDRIGSFHEIAYRIIKSDEDIVIVEEDDNFLGVKSGVNIVFHYNKKKVGVIGITGKPAQVKPIALVIKMSMETMLEYEMYKETLLQRKNKKEQFLNYLLYGHDKDKNKITVLSEQLGYHENLIRIPILICFNGVADAEQLLSSIKKNELHSSQDISELTEDGQIIIFKHFKNKNDLFSSYKYLMEEYLERFLDHLKEQSNNYKIYIGTFQNQYLRYSAAFHHCLWLRENVAMEDKIIYFYDRIGSYIHSLIPRMELYDIYHVFDESMYTEFKENFMDIVEALINNNYNLVESSKELFIHKNTMIFRFNKIREWLDMNPMNKSEDRNFINYLYDHIKNNNVL